MRLADQMGLPDRRASFIEGDLSKWEGEKPPCCAIGGASVASRSFQFESTVDQILSDESLNSARFINACHDWHEFVAYRVYACPVCPIIKDSAYRACIHLYDAHLWSRTQIGDWLDSQPHWKALEERDEAA
jgi:hypothetical protein